MNNGEVIKSVYIHVPFCKNICSYCDFCKFLYNEKWVDNYLKTLKKEIKDRYLDEPIKSVYFGGGTPSALNIKHLKELLNIMKLFRLEPDAEITFECNLNDITEQLVSILKENRINRISIGIQSFNKKILKFLNREADFKDCKNKIELIHQYGIDNINADLIYAIPDQNILMLKKDLRLFNKLNINHISTYSLMIEPNTVLSSKNTLPIDENLDYRMYKLICKYLKRKKFIHYEVSNFSKKGYESRHNLTYWNNEEYYGFGPGASGYIEGVRYENNKNLNKYFNDAYVFKEEILSEKEIMDYEIILGLRKCEGIDIKKFYDKFHVNVQSEYPIEELIKTKDLIYKNGKIFINPKKTYIMNEILIKLI